MFRGKSAAQQLEDRLDETFDSGIRKREEHTEHTRPTSRPPPSATADLVTLTREDGTIPEMPWGTFLSADELAAIEEARALYMRSQALPPHEFQELRDLLGDVLHYGSFDPNAVPIRGMWSELAEMCLRPRAIMVLGLVDGARTIAEIVRQSGLSVSEAVAELEVLVEHGALDA